MERYLFLIVFILSIYLINYNVLAFKLSVGNRFHLICLKGFMLHGYLSIIPSCKPVRTIILIGSNKNI